MGDRYVIEKMRTEKSTLGGESSGHIIVNDMSTTGDGVVAALQVMQALQYSSRSLHDICSDMQKYPQKLINVPVAEKLRHINDPIINQAVKHAEQAMVGRGRVLLRPSGTEPLVRVMVEADDMSLVDQHINEVSAVVKQQLSMSTSV